MYGQTFVFDKNNTRGQTFVFAGVSGAKT